MLAGIKVAGGILLLFGPAVILPALVAGTGTALTADIRHRPMNDAEQDLALSVYGDKTPIDRIVLTDLYNPSTDSAGKALDCESTFPRSTEGSG